MQELKPCPFCGGAPVLHVCDGAGLYHVPAKSATEDVRAGDASYCGRKMAHKMFVCQKCGAKTKQYLTHDGVRRAWNRRAE